MNTETFTGDHSDPYKVKPSMLPEYISQADQHLYQSQKKYESMVELEGKARDAYTDALLAYEQKYGDYIKENKSKGSITVLKEEATSFHFDLYKAMVKAESDLKKLQSGKEMYLERINTCKLFLKLKTGDLR